jgi:hypothetical protein
LKCNRAVIGVTLSAGSPNAAPVSGAAMVEENAEPDAVSPSDSPAISVPRALPQSLGMVAHLWAAPRGPVDLEIVAPILTEDASGPID